MSVAQHELEPFGIRGDYDTSYSGDIESAIDEKIAPYVAAAERVGVNPDEVREALQPVHREREVFVGEIDSPEGPIPFISTRVRVGALGDDRANRGGTEKTAAALPPKIAGKAGLMAGKQSVAGTDDAGGKGGIAVAAEYTAAVTPEVDRRLAAGHALVHNINPFDNPTATDIQTFSHHMDAMVAALEPRYGRFAAAAAAGASQEYGGIPEYSADCTGLGASIVTEEYLIARANDGDEAAREALSGGRQLRILQQAAGKAGAPFARSLPAGTELAGLMEYNGGIYSPDAALDPDEIIAISRQTNGLDRTAHRPGQNWLPSGELPSFWQQGAEIGAPAFDRDQVTAADVLGSSVIAWACIANDPLTSDALEAARANRIDVLDGIATNKGGTLFSHLRANMLLHNTHATPQALKTDWNTRMRDSSAELFSRLFAERRRTGEFVTVSDITAETVALDAVRRLRNPVKLQLVG